MTATRTFTSANAFVFLAIPMFIFMGNMLEISGIAKSLYTMMYKWMGGLRGGLAIGTVAICSVFAAMVGVSGASTVSMALVALPSMLQHKYNDRLAIGAIASGGALGVLIPPSVMMIILGMYTNTSIGMLYAGGVLPGILLSVLFMIYIGIICYFKPSMAPALSRDNRAGMAEKLEALRAIILPVLLIIGVIGSIFAGIATPSEAAAVGALGSIICAAVYKKLSWGKPQEMQYRYIEVQLHGHVDHLRRLGFYRSLHRHRRPGFCQRPACPASRRTLGQLIGMQLILVALGCFLDPTGIIMITTPIFFPIAKSLGFDPVWFGVIYAINMEMGFLTPPFGFNLFYMQSVAPPHVTMMDIYKAIIPFILIEIAAIALCMFFRKSLPGCRSCFSARGFA